MERQENRLQQVLDNLPVLVAFLDKDQRYEFANYLHFSWFGIDPASFSGSHISEVIGDEAYSVLKSHIGEACSGKKSTYIGEVPYSRGGKRYIQSTAVPLIGEGKGNILLLTTDLTEHKLMESELDATTLRSRTVLETAVDGIITIDENGIIQSCNDSAQKLFGYSAGEMIGHNVNMLMPSPDAENHDGYIRRYLETGEKRIIGIGREVTGKRKDGSEFPMELAVGEFVQNGRHYFTGFTRDITARKKAEFEARSRLNELAHLSRLNTNHHLATNISHEINQPLTAIVTMAQALLRNLRSGRNDPGMVESTLEKLVRQGSRASNIIQEIRQYYRKGDSDESSPHNIDDIITDVLLLLEHEIIENNVKVETRLGSGDAIVRVNRVQIEQVVLNLVQNAIEAMTNIKEKRLLKINTSVSQQSYVEVSIEDNGAGLPENEKSIFDPFFSTKREGMGQGLSICRSIVEAHGGTIEATSNHGRGAIFRFTLPIEPPEPLAA